MKKKLQILKKLRKFRNYSKGNKNQELTSKLYKAFFINCILFSKNSFTITFKNKKVRPSLGKWISYLKEWLYRFYLITIYSRRNVIIVGTYEDFLIKYGADKPTTWSFSNTPDEIYLNFICCQTCLEIIGESITIDSISYTIYIA